jgi:hypothetical protein
VCARADHRAPGNEFDTFTDQLAAQQSVRSLISTPRQGDPLWIAIGIARSTPGFCFRRPVDDVKYFIARLDVLLSTRQIAIH